MNSKAAWRLAKQGPSKGYRSPVVVHMSYHTKKLERMAAVTARWGAAKDPEPMKKLAPTDGSPGITAAAQAACAGSPAGAEAAESTPLARAVSAEGVQYSW